ncbi:hypothetical protein GGR53DRAFT_528443 [Hypoxylon sp. FL1150]|nr:hypothetical protein GGR53DRAFT_528443 [Hypoxylon sp. FL1150]
MANHNRTGKASLLASNDRGDVPTWRREEAPRQSGFLSFPSGQPGSSKANYDVVTVHGLRDDFKTAWTDKEGTRWVKDQLFEGREVREVNFSYEIDEYSTIYEPLFMEHSHAGRLLMEYAEVRKKLGKAETNRPIIWICSDIGGAIVKQALLSASDPRMDAEWGKIAMLTKAIIFLDPLHQFQRVYYVQEQLRKLIGLSGPEIKYRPEIKAKNLAIQVQSINEAFIKTKLLDRAAIFNVFGRNSPSINIKEGHRIYLEGEPLESSGITLCVDVDHLDLVRGCQSQHDKWVSGMANTFSRSGCGKLCLCTIFKLYLDKLGSPSDHEYNVNC